MRKSLSLLLAIAMVFSMFSSLAFAADETTLTTQQKYDALAAKGIFAGINGEAALDQNMTRAQFARVIALIQGLEGIGNPDTKVVTEKPFSDVELGTWYVEEIAAVKESENKLFEGNTDGTFGPKSDITVQQLAVVIAKVLELDVVEDAEIEGAAPWAAGYIQAIINAGVTFPTNYTEPATRGDLANAAFTADAKINPDEPAKVSVTSASATGVKQVTVVLDKAVDTEKATLSLKKGSITVALNAPKWSEDKKTATVELKDVKISEGEYTVTLGGLEADSVDKTTASFTAEKEVVKSIEFITASDEIAFTKKAKVRVKASNQYGENASFPSSSYSVFTGYNGLGERVTKDDDGTLVIELNTDAPGTSPYILNQGQSQIPLTIYYNETRVTTSKTFKLGIAPFVTKLELGDAKYDGNKTSLVNKGEVAIVPVRLFDQYGNPITADQDLTNLNFNEIVLPHIANLSYETDDFDNDNYYETKVTLNGKEAKTANYTLTVYGGGASATATISVGAAKVATTVGFGEFNDVLAAGDTMKHYVPVVGYDVDGNQLTKDELVDDTNFARIKVNVSGQVSSPGTLIRTGPNKGSIEITSVNAGSQKGTVFITASISEIDANDFKTMNINIQDVRLPETLVVDKKSSTKAVLGARSEFKVLVQDQYGKKMDNFPSGYFVNVTLTNLDSTTPLITLDGKGSNTIANGFATGSTLKYDNSAGKTSKDFNEGFEFVTSSGVFGKAQFKAELIKELTATTPETSLKVATQEIESVNPLNVKLSYALKSINSLYAAMDSNLLPAPVAPATVEDATTSKLAKKVEVAVTDSAGNSVAFPDNQIQHVTVSNSTAVQYGSVDDAAPATTKKYFVIGNKAGTSTVTATVYSADGNIVHASGEVTVSADQVTVDTISAGNGDKNFTSTADRDAYKLMDLKVVDNYGIEYKEGNIDKYKKLIGITYSITGIKGGEVKISAGNVITIDPAVTEFLLTAHAPNGKTASTLIFR